MNEIYHVAGSELPPRDSRTWIGRILIGVVLGEAIWGFFTSITTNLALPAMARFMGGDAQSPLYLGNGDFKFAALFTSLLELCFAGIVALVLNSWSQRTGGVRSKSLRHIPAARPADSPTSPAVTTGASAQQSARGAEPAKEKPPKKVYYNIVGEPVETDDE